MVIRNCLPIKEFDADDTNTISVSTYLRTLNKYKFEIIDDIITPLTQFDMFYLQYQLLKERTTPVRPNLSLRPKFET